MHEYEFRLVVQSALPFDTLMYRVQEAWGEGRVEIRHVWYAKHHFRFRKHHLEIKTKLSSEMVYYDGLWFQWIHSQEIPFQQWSRTHHSKFLDMAGNYMCPFRKETRLFLKLDQHAQLYAFQHVDGTYRLIFEWEYGTFSLPLETEPTYDLMHALDPYDKVLEPFHTFPPPPYQLNESMTRKPVSCVANFDCLRLNEHLVAHKVDGIFGFVYSFDDFIKEKWEGSVQKRRNHVTLGNGIVFAAEKMPNDTVVLLDVYQVRGIPTAKWARESILIHFLSTLGLPDGFQVQQYRRSVEDLNQCLLPTDGYICHNIQTDHIVKIKHHHSLDVVYMDGFFWLPAKEKLGLNYRFKSLEKDNQMQEGHVYEVSTQTGRVIRERNDRFVGNTWQQITNVLEKQPWQGPPIQEVVKIKKRGRKRIIVQ